ncbi:MAG: M23 family metallopeptidase [bacterium]
MGKLHYAFAAACLSLFSLASAPLLAGDLFVALEAHQPGNFVSANPPAVGTVETRPWVADWETFLLIDEDILLNEDAGRLRHGDRVLLMTFHDTYLTALYDNTPPPATPRPAELRSFQSVPQGWEVFVIEKQNIGPGGDTEIRDGDQVAFKAFKDIGSKAFDQFLPSEATYISAPNGGAPGNPLMADASTAGGNETFTLKVLGQVDIPTMTKLSSPLPATNLFKAGNYVDLDRREKMKQDWLGGDQTYDNHTGIDFGDNNTFSEMDLGGHEVVAAAPGKVVFVEDSNEDRCHSESDATVCPGTSEKKANTVVIRQEDGNYALYVHLMRNSVKLKVGDEVQCGDFVGKMGSAGDSSAPHLHFEIRRPYRPNFKDLHPDSIDASFWNQSRVLDPYQGGAWQELDKRRFPKVTCKFKENLPKAARGNWLSIRAAAWGRGEYDSCANRERCRPGLFCSSAGICERPRNLGENCGGPDICEAGLFCQDGGCRRVGVGPHGDCDADRLCGPGLDCQAGHCEWPAPPAALAPSCTQQCPVFPHPNNCFLDAEGQCKREVIENWHQVRVDCDLICLP